MRFGDGHIYAANGEMLGCRRKGIKKITRISQELQECLRIRHPLFLTAVSGCYPVDPGMEPGLFAPFQTKDNLERILQRYTDQETFLNPVLFHYMGVFQPKTLKGFIAKYIKDQPKMFIGCCSRENMERFFGKIDVYVKTPPANSYNSIDSWWPEIERNYKDVKVVLPCTGVSSVIIAKRLWELNADIHCLDIGSIVDAIDGDFESRTCWRMRGKEVRGLFLGEHGKK